MNVFVIGTVDFSLSVLEKLLTLPVTICGVATKSRSRINADHADLTPLCEREGVPYKFVRDVNAPHILSWIRSLEPACVLVCGWSQLIGPELLALPPRGVIGYHPAALPANRGRHPLIWALVLGLKETASTFMLLDEGADSGPIVSQVAIPISENDDAASLYAKMTATALIQLEQFLPGYLAGDLQHVAQNHALANHWRKRGRADGKIDFRMPVRGIVNLVRGLTRPYVGAHVERGDEDIKVWRAAPGGAKPPNIEPGKVLETGEYGIHVAAADGVVVLLDHEFTTLPEKHSYL